MKKMILTLGTLLLGGCLAAVAQTGSSQAVQTSPSNSQASALQGCLSQAADGNFMLADNSGNNFQLRGDTSQLNNYVGKEIQVHGIAVNSSGTSANAMSSDATGTAAGTAKQFTVSDVHKVAETCAASK